MRFLLGLAIPLLYLALNLSLEGARILINEPFEGVTHYQIRQEQPRKVSIHLLEIDPTAPGISFLTTPSNGGAPGDTTHQTTRGFVTQHGVQIGVNANFSDYSPGYPNMNLLNIAASNGDVYSPFYAGWPGINVTQDNKVYLVEPVPENELHEPPFYSGFDPDPDVPLYNTVGGNELTLHHGQVVATWADGLHPRTAAGVTAEGKLLLLTVDGRNTGHSQGMSTTEVAHVLKQYGAVHGLNLDGGGSTTMVFADPTPRVVNIPVGISNQPGTERYVGNSFGVFANLREGPLETTHIFASFDHLVNVPTPSGSIFLHAPSYSGSTSGNVVDHWRVWDDSMVVGEEAVPANSEARQALRLRWAFRPDLAEPWLRVPTHTDSAAMGQPIIPFEKFVRFDVYASHDITVLLLVRNTSSTGEIGETGVASGGFEFVGGPPAAEGQIVAVPPQGKRVPARRWTTLYFDMANDAVTGWDVNDPLLNGNGALETVRGVIQSLVFVPIRDDEGTYSLATNEVYLNNFQISQTGPAPVPLPTVSIQRGDGGERIRLSLRGQAHTVHVVEVSGNLVDWSEAGTVELDADGNGTFTDDSAEPGDRRFYRLR